MVYKQLLTIVICFSSTAIVAADRPAVFNLVVDSSLEGRFANLGLPPDWVRTPAEDKGLEAYAISGGRTGQRQLHFRSLGDWASVSTPRMTRQHKSKQSGEVWFRPVEKSAGDVLVYITYFKEDGNVAGTSGAAVVSFGKGSINSEWQRLHTEHRGDAFPDAHTFNLEVAMSKPGTALFDDFGLTQTLDESVTPLISYGDMELPEKELLPFTRIWKPENTVVHLSRETDRPHSGAACLRFKGSAEWATFQFAEFAIPAGKTVQGSVWIRARQGGCSVMLRAIGPTGIVFQEYLSKPMTPSWYQTSWKLTPAKLGNADKMVIELADSKDFDVCIDDVYLTLE